MDAYPPDYIAHNFPFVVLSGFKTDATEKPSKDTESLFREGDVVIDSDWSLLEIERSKYLLKELLECHADTDAILPRTTRNEHSIRRFHFKVTGRVGMFDKSFSCLLKILNRAEICTPTPESAASARAIITELL